MNSKERVLRAIDHQDVDRVPAGLFGTHIDYEDLLVEHIGVSSYEDMYKTLGIDIWHCRCGLDYTGEQRRRDGVDTDAFGICWDTPSRLAPPFADAKSVDEVENYLWPSIDDFDGRRLAKEVEEHQEFAVVGGINSAVFHWYGWMCVQENAFAYLALQPEIAHAIISRITDFWCAYLEKTLEAGSGKIDIIENCNDFGTQRSMFISSDMFREFFKPALKRLYDVAKRYDVKVMQHSCGAIRPIISDFIEMGADILNPIQVTADGMDIESIAADYGDRIAFYGGIDTQYLLPQGPVEKIRRETQKVIDLFGSGGGYILSGSQGLMLDIPVEHAVAMFEEGKRGL